MHHGILSSVSTIADRHYAIPVPPNRAFVSKSRRGALAHEGAECWQFQRYYFQLIQ